jgi:hypothetical protein
MRFTSKSFIDNSVTDEEIGRLVEVFSEVPDSKVFSSDEEKDIRKSWLSLGTTLTNCAKGRMIPVEFKPFVKSFEKADYDITKLPKELKLGLDKTYNDFKSVAGTNEYNKAAPELYCKIYEFFSNANVTKFFKRVKSDPIAKKNSIGLESFDMESVENLLYENGLEIQSIESPISLAKTMGLIPSIKGAVMGATTTVANVNNLLNVIMLLLIACTILITVLIIVHMKYEATLNKVVLENSEKNIMLDKKSSVTSSINIMNDETGPLVKNLVIRPALHVESICRNITTKSYDFFDKALKNVKNLKSKEDIDEINESENVEDKSEEGVIDSLVGKGIVAAGAKIGSGFAAVGAFVGAHSAIFITAAVIASVVLLITCIKPLIYYVYRLKLRVSTFFKDQAEMLEVNFDNIRDKINDPRTSPSEKTRLEGILAKQKTIAQKLAAYSKALYGDSNIAAMDARDDIRNEDKIDYDKEIEIIDDYEEKQREEIAKKEQPEIVPAPTPSQTTVIF